ncbi:MAG: hypothetical protein LBH00_02220 [Planctomycetaceae bacterium]|jgi:hypothetical protein|nr:hypothetical protein [Planctomycetaceae bacterium]
MKIRDFLEHHGILGNPFSEEDAQNDVVFKTACVGTAFHSAWDKIFGNPAEPATSIVFGEKGSGKTALRLQMIEAVNNGAGNRSTGSSRRTGVPLVVDYSDLNPFIDRFRHRFSPHTPIAKVIAKWELWDHLDAILSLAVTQLIDRILEPGNPPANSGVSAWNPHQVRDMLLLAACYDTSRSENPLYRWKKLARKLRYGNFRSFFANRRERFLGIGGSLAAGWLAYFFTDSSFAFLLNRWFWIAVVILFLPLLAKIIKRFWQAWKLKRSLRVLPQTKGKLYKILMCLQKQDFAGMPFPVSGSTDHRYEMLAKLLGVCGQVTGGGHPPAVLSGLIVIMDRVDEPYLINGSPELMKLLVWSIFDNKLLKHDRVGLKLLLPDQLLVFIERENSEFHQRARLDKQNLIRSLDWTGEALLDLANIRLQACAAEGTNSDMTELFEPAIDRRRLTDAFAKLKVPRHLFKFLYLLLQKHVNDHTDTEPAWKISAAAFETVLALYLRDREAAEKNLGVI